MTKADDQKEKQENPFTMVLAKADKERFKTFAKEHGIKTISGFLKECARIVMNNPKLLDPTSTPSDDITTLYQIVQAENKRIDQITSTFDKFANQLKLLVRYQMLSLQEMGMDKEDILKQLPEDARSIFE